ncbi:MAG: IclR family transcriptional regulator [Kineosporiaceae bacterium]
MIQSIDRAARVLASLQGSRHLGITEIAERLRLSPSTAHGIVRTLAAHGLVVQEPGGKRYMLGPALVRLSSVYLDTHEVRGRSLPWMEDLARSTGLAVRLGVELLDEVMILHHVARPDGSRQMPETGISLPVHACALGKVLLSGHPEAARALLGRDPLRSLTGDTVTDPQAVLAGLPEIAARGLATERDEVVVGESALASPVVDRTGAVVAALGLVVPSAQWPEGPSDPRLDEWTGALRGAARAVSRELGATHWP